MSDASLNDVSVACMLLREFSRQSIADQTRLKTQLELVVRSAIAVVPIANRAVFEMAEGFAVVVLASPAAALELAERAQATAADLPLCVGLNYGPVKLTAPPDANPEIVGDGLVEAVTLARLATRGPMLASRAFRDALHAHMPHRAAALASVGAFTDAELRKHELFTVSRQAAIARQRRVLLLSGIAVAALIAAGIGIRSLVGGLPRAPGVIVFDIAPQGVIYIDGEMRGISPPIRKVQLPPGQHAIEVRHSPNPPLKLTVNVKAGQEMTVAHSFFEPKRGQRGGRKGESYVEQLRRQWGL